MGMTAAAPRPGILAVTNPASGAVLAELPVATPAEVDATIARAQAAQPAWAATPRHQRHRVMHAFADLMEEHADELSRLLAEESGKPLAQSESEIAATTRLYRCYSERMLARSEAAEYLDSQPGYERDLLFTRHEPLGVIGAILPFNFPSELLSHKAGPAIAMGNAVVLKPSREDPLTVLREGELWLEAGLPEGIFQPVVGGAAVGTQLVEDPRIAALSFTGSTEVGIELAGILTKRLAPAFLELGGNDAMIVLDDADVSLVVSEAVTGRLACNGQCCVSNKRIIVEARLYEAVLQGIADRFGKLVMGDPLDEATELGPLINQSAAEGVEEEVRRTVAEGAKLVTGGERQGCYFRPTVLSGVTREMAIATDMEVFGPVLPIIPVSSTEEAISLANASRYGLSGSVFSSDIGRALDVALRLQTGQVVVNGTGQGRADVAAFGGYKYSGVGREGLCCLDEFVQNKNIVLRRVLPAN